MLKKAWKLGNYNAALVFSHFPEEGLAFAGSLQINIQHFNVQLT